MFTEKEVKVLTLRKKSLNQLEIAKKLNISQPAVSSFEQSIIRKIKSSLRVLKIAKKTGIKLSEFKLEEDL